MRKPVSYNVLRHLIIDGYGQGHGETYQPFLQVSRGHSSPCSYQIVTQLPGLKRKFHFLSRPEHYFALFLVWIGAEVREQYPLWPWRHAHPLCGHPQFPQYREVSGLLEIAKSAGIKHGSWVGTNIPYVATTDILATHLVDHTPRLHAFAMKRESQLIDLSKYPRVSERLELERRYFEEIRNSWRVVHDTLLPAPLTRNLELIAGSANLAETFDGEQLTRFSETFQGTSSNLPLEVAIHKSGSAVGLDPIRAHRYFRMCAWRGSVDIDLSKPMDMNLPMAAGGSVIRERFVKEFLPHD